VRFLRAGAEEQGARAELSSRAGKEKMVFWRQPEDPGFFPGPKSVWIKSTRKFPFPFRSRKKNVLELA
jgi:hypothetical protein